MNKTWRVAVKYKSGWFIAYEGSDYRCVEAIKAKYRDRTVKIERI